MIADKENGERLRAIVVKMPERELERLRKCWPLAYGGSLQSRNDFVRDAIRLACARYEIKRACAEARIRRSHFAAVCMAADATARMIKGKDAGAPFDYQGYVPGDEYTDGDGQKYRVGEDGYWHPAEEATP